MRLKNYIIEKDIPKKKWVTADIAKMDKIDSAKLWFMFNKTYRSEGFQDLDAKSFNEFISKHEMIWYIDIDNDPEPDAFIAYRKEKYGNKIVLLASDDKPLSKTLLIKKLVKLMKTKGWFMEASHKIAKILIKNNVPIVDDEEKVKKILYPDIEWLGDGEYKRYLLGTNFLMQERMFGYPNI